MRLPSLAVLRTQSDDRLVTLARAGSEEAFEAIVERYRRPLLRHARKLLMETGAEDAVQQALLSAWTALRRGDDVRELGAWLHRILHNVALNALRAAKSGAFVELPESLAAGVVPDDEIERRMAMRRTLAGVAALPEHQREALLRVAIQGRSQAEVARALGLSHGAVGQLVLRGRRALRGAATALTPQWLVEWLSTLGGEGRIAEVAAGAGAGGAALTLGKVAAVVAVAGTATAGPGLVQHHGDQRPPVAEARVALPRAAPELAHRGSRVAPSGDLLRSQSAGVRTKAGHGGGSSGPGPGGSASSRSESSGAGQRGSGSSGSGSSGSGSSGSGSSGTGSSGSGSGHSGSGGSGSSGSGSGHSGSSGSGSSGSGSGHSGSSGSGSGGSGSSGSSSRASGSSGSGTSGSGTSTPSTSGSGTSTPSSSGSGSSGSGSGDDSD